MEDTTGNTELDSSLDSSVETLASGLGLGDASPADGSATPIPEAGKDVEKKVVSPDPIKQAVQEPAASTVAAVTPRAAPKSWPKETQEYWGKLDPKVQDLVERREKDFLDGLEQYKGDAGFAKQIRDTLAPYQALMTAQNITDPAIAVKGLMNAHYQLSSSDEAARTSFMANLVKQYRIDPAKLVELAGKPVISDPAMDAMRTEINSLKTGITAEQTRQATEVRTKVNAEVAAFAADPAHPYFDEVANDIVLQLQDPKIDLKEAYERSVRANPQTWAKEQVRLTAEIEARIRKDAEEAAKAAKRNKGTNVRGAESTKAPTEVLGSQEDTLRETYREIHSRTT